MTERGREGVWQRMTDDDSDIQRGALHSNRGKSSVKVTPPDQIYPQNTSNRWGLGGQPKVDE